MSQDIDIFGKLEIIQVAMQNFAGKKSQDDIDNPNLCDAENRKVETPGGKWVIDKSKLRPFWRLKNEVTTILALEGVGFMNGYAYADSTAKAALQRLKKISLEWENEVENFVANYQTYVKEWASKNPSWKDSIERSAPTPEQVRLRFKFAVAHFAMVPKGSFDGLNNHLEEEASGLAVQVAKEIASDVRANIKSTTSKCRKVFERCARKASLFAFADPRLASCAEAIQTVLAALPPEGRFNEAQKLLVSTLVPKLSDHQVILGEKLLEMTPTLLDEEEELPLEDSNAATEPQPLNTTQAVMGGKAPYTQATDDLFSQEMKSSTAFQPAGEARVGSGRTTEVQSGQQQLTRSAAFSAARGNGQAGQGARTMASPTPMAGRGNVSPITRGSAFAAARMGEKVGSNHPTQAMPPVAAEPEQASQQKEAAPSSSEVAVKPEVKSAMVVINGKEMTREEAVQFLAGNHAA